MASKTSVPKISPKLFLFIGVLSFAFGAILIKYSSAPAIAIAFYRLFFAASIMGLISVGSKVKSQKLDTKDFMILIFNGFVLATHFVFWISSLKYTTVAASVVLVDTSPFFATIFAYTFLKEKVGRNHILGIILCFIGTILILGSDISLETNLYGDLLALVGGVLAGFYFFVGRKMRPKIEFLPYVTYVYSFSTFFLLLYMIMFNVPFFGYTVNDYIIFFLLAAGPSCLGHNSYNYSLKYLKASIVSATVYGEALGSTILAIILFNETPSSLLVLGSISIMVGIYIAVIRA
ncbi:MAG: DMT family transporter [Nitrososphaeria archaeon]|nr:DMT family transporter [Nitrososphaeria archaeon]